MNKESIVDIENIIKDNENPEKGSQTKRGLKDLFDKPKTKKENPTEIVKEKIKISQIVKTFKNSLNSNINYDETNKLYNPSSKLADNPNYNQENKKKEKDHTSKKDKKSSDEEKESIERSQLRLLLRFNCGTCQRKYSKIFLPYNLSCICNKCKYPSDLVVLRCDTLNLYGGYLCSSCENRFVEKIEMKKFHDITPFCNGCEKYTKMYQALLNKSKISIKNTKVFTCLECNLTHTQSFYLPKGNLGVGNPKCCNNPTVFTEYSREFIYHKLDDEGRSINYSNNTKEILNNQYFGKFNFNAHRKKKNWYGDNF